MAVTPADFRRRSPVYRELEALGAEFAEVNGSAAAISCGREVAAETEQARALGLCDLSALRRGGFKGWRTSEWLREEGVEVDDESNRAYPQADGSLIARLSPGEVLILGDLSGGSAIFEKLMAAWNMAAGEGTYPVPRADTNCCFGVTGRFAGAMFAKLCGVDLRPEKFADRLVAQTSIARLNAIVIRADLGEVLAYTLLTDSASAPYMWGCLIDAAAEFAGAPVGLGALRKLAER
jgi:sarcosine oxidase subunit gamma